MTGEIVPFNGADAAAVRTQAQTARAEMTRQVATLKAQAAAQEQEMKARIAALEADLRRQRAELEAQMAPMVQQMKQMAEVLWTVDLYLGREETLRLIRDGEPAPADTPLTIRQKVLVMAEESLVMMGRKVTGMDASDVPEFVSWLISDDAHLDRVLPEPKGLVVLIPTRVESRTGNAWEDAAKDAANSASYWLLRNGQRLYLLTVDPELRVTQRVLPRRSEFTEVFDQGLFGFGRRHGDPVVPGSEEWLAMEKIADGRRRHYMRIMLVLQGLIDRTPAWHPLPPGGINLLSVQAQDDGRVVLIQDAEESIQLTDGRESFRAWQRRLNGLLRPGLRLIGDWHNADFSHLHEKDWRGRSFNPRVRPETCLSLPDPTVPHLIEDRRDGGLVIRFERTDLVYRRNVPVPDKPGYVYRGEHSVEPSRRASVLVMPDDTWVLPYDLVTVPDLEYYLNSRDNRSKHFLSMVPTIRAALAAKKAEAETEAPFREFLGRLLIAEGVEEDQVSTVVDDLVQWWKIAHTWARPLNGEPKHEGKAAREIVAEYRSRQGRAVPDAVLRAGKAIPGVIAVAANRQGQWFAYAPSTPAHDQGVFLDITPIHKNGTLGRTRTWQTVPQRSASLLNVAWSNEEWAGWKFSANPRHYLTGPERDALIAAALAETEGLPILAVEYHDPADPGTRVIGVYAWTDSTPPEDAPLRLHDNPLSWHWDGPVTVRQWAVAKTAHGVSLGEPSRVLGKNYSRFSTGTPYWPADAYRYSDPRPRLIWEDASNRARLEAWVHRCVTAYREDRQRVKDRDTMLYRYVDAVSALIEQRRTAAIREKFLLDYGPDADDLWEAHLASQPHAVPVHPRTLWGLLAIAHEHGEPFVGKTLDALSDFALAHNNRAPGEWRPDHGRQDMGAYGDIVVPEVADDQA